MHLVIACLGMLVAPLQQPGASPLDRPVTLALERVSLKTALDQVARQAGVRIAYSRRVVPLDRPVSAQLEGVPVRVALDTLLQGTGAVPTLDRTGQILLTDPPGDRPGGALAQGSITGTVRAGAAATPLAGVNVIAVGTSFSATTDSGGRYAIAGVPVGTYHLRARSPGYTPGDTTVVVREGLETVADFRLQRSPIELNPIVAIGYGTALKHDLTGAVSSVTADQFETKAAPTITLSSGLQGKAAGVQVTSNTGLPGGGLRVRVRGTGSITANSEPLYVIDGLPAEQGTSSSDPKANPLMAIDAHEIEAINVLKDASATAIYGARGANGVVLITTRRGQVGESRVTFETSAGFQEIAKTIPVLSGPQFMLLSNEARINAAKPPLYSAAQIAAAQTYDYPSMLLRTAPQTSQALTFAGGDQRLRYLFSANYAYQQGIEIGSDFARYGGRLNLDADVSPRFRVGTSLSFTRAARNAPSVENGSLGNSANGIQAAMEFAPFQAPRDAAGGWIKTSPSTEPVPNPIANATDLTDLNTTSRLLGSAFGELDLTPSLRVRTTFGGNFQFDGIHNFAPRSIIAGGVAGAGWMFSGTSRNLTNENTLTWRRAMGPGRLDLLGGFSVQTWYSENLRADGANFPTDATTVYNLGSGSQLIPPGTGISESAILSYLARANYNIADKYLFTLTGRRDGSSVFGANHKWALFPSAAFAWRLGDETFMQHQSLFNDVKLRVSYGTVGNQAVSPYQSLAGLSTRWYSFGSTEFPALSPSTAMPNPDLKWEKQTQLNVGVDAALLQNRVLLTFDAYRSTTNDLLLSIPLPSTSGYSSQLRNIGSVRNRGVEVSLNTVNVERGRFSWRSSLNVAANRNRVLTLRTANDSLFLSPRTGNFFSPSDVYLLTAGLPLGAIYGYQVTGLWQTGDVCYLKTPAVNCVPGEYKIADRNGDSVITASDRTILGYGDPKFYGGVGNTLSFGPLTLDAFFNFSSGNKIINGGNAYGDLLIMQNNERTTALDRWTPTHTNTTVPRANQGRPRRLYSTLVEDGSYLRLQTLTLSYQLPPGFIPHAASARAYLTGQNLFVLTHYTGFDPDVNSMGGDARFGGIDIGAYPRARVWNFGVTATY